MTTDPLAPRVHPHARLPEHVCADFYCPTRAPATAPNAGQDRVTDSAATDDRCPNCGGEWTHLHDEDRIDHTRSWWQCRDCDQLRAQARRK